MERGDLIGVTVHRSSVDDYPVAGLLKHRVYPDTCSVEFQRNGDVSLWFHMVPNTTLKAMGRDLAVLPGPERWRGLLERLEAWAKESTT